MKAMVTGASGFVGQNLCAILEGGELDVVPAIRKPIDATTEWADQLSDVDVVIHLAARVHVMNSGEAGDLASFREINVEGTRNLAKQAAQSGVKRFVFLSSIKVNGERTHQKPFSADQECGPEDAYAISKLEAEVTLREIEQETNMEVVIIRPPLVYGPGVKGNLATLVSMIKKGIPLPLGAVNNRRDLVSIYNLCDLIRVCCLHSEAAGKTFLVSDGESISTAELVRYLAKGLESKARLHSVPIWALKFGAGIFGKRGTIEKLTGSLQIDMSATQEILDWTPPFTVAESFRKMFAEE